MQTLCASGSDTTLGTKKMVKMTIYPQTQTPQRLSLGTLGTKSARKRSSPRKKAGPELPPDPALSLPCLSTPCPAAPRRSSPCCAQPRDDQRSALLSRLLNFTTTCRIFSSSLCARFTSPLFWHCTSTCA